MAAGGNDEGHDGMNKRCSRASCSQDTTEHFPTIGAIEGTLAALKIPDKVNAKIKDFYLNLMVLNIHSPLSYYSQ